MTGLRVKFTGKERLGRRSRRILRGMDMSVLTALALSAEEVRGEAQRAIERGTRSGRLRPDGTRSSAAGEFPKTDTGVLAGSIFAEVDRSSLSASVGTDLEYGKHLELGTQKMGARPWLFPTFERLKSRISRRFRELAKRSLNR